MPTSELAMSLGCPRGPKHSQSNILLTSDGVMQQGVKDELQLADSMRSKVRLGRGQGGDVQGGRGMLWGVQLPPSEVERGLRS